MKHGFAAVICTMLLLATAVHARAAGSVEVTETFPAGDRVMLPSSQTYYLHLRYHSQVPTRIWAEPYFRGKPAHAGSNPSHTYPAGSGEALGWFFLFDDGDQVDEVRFRMGDGTTRGTREVARYPVSITATAATAKRLTPPWAERLLAVDEQLDREARQAVAAEPASADEPVSAADQPSFNGFMLAMYGLGLIAFLGPLWGLWRWRGLWRIAATLPALAMAYVVLRLNIDTARDPTSHNLWPFEILFTSALCVGGFCQLSLLRFILTARKR